MTKFLIVLAIISSSTFAQDISGDVLLDSFRSGCRSLGSFSSAALNDTRNLIRSIESIKDDPNCAGIGASISSLSAVERKLAELNSEYSETSRVSELEGQEIEIMAQISKLPLTNTDTIKELESTLRQIQIEKAGLVASNESYREYNGGKLRNLFSAIVSTSESTFNTLARNQSCLAGNPSIISTATSAATSIGAAASFVNPAFGLGLAATSQIIGAASEYYRARSDRAQRRNIILSTNVYEGLSCAMETFTNRYCEAQDALAFLDIEEDLERNNDAFSELSFISDLYDVKVPVFLGWLEQVKSGAPASNSADADRRIRISQKRESVNAAKILGQGLFAENRSLFDSARATQKFDVIRRTIKDLSKGFSSSNSPYPSSHPLLDIYTYGYVPYYLIGLTIEEVPDDGIGGYKNFDNFNPDTDLTGYVPNFELMVAKYEEWVEEAERRTNQELNLVQQPDPLKILSDYFQPTSNEYRVSPSDSILEIIKFIEDNRPARLFSSSADDLYTTTIERLKIIDQAVRGTIEGGVCPPVNEASTVYTECDERRAVLDLIFKKAELGFGQIFFQNRLESIIKIAIDQFIQNSENQGDTRIAQLLAADSFLDVLKRVSGKDNTSLIRADMNRTLAITISNMDTFTDAFGALIERAMKKNDKFIDSRDESLAGPFKLRRAKMCMFLASLPEWPIGISYNSKEKCLGYMLGDKESGRPVSSVITEEFLQMDQSKRACEYYNYTRNSVIFDNWGIKL